jgi:hypothetical protein
MKLLAATIMPFFLIVSKGAHAQAASASVASETVQHSQMIKITRSDFLHSSKGSSLHFIGSVEVEELFPATDPSRAS